MSNYLYPRTTSLASAVQERKAAHKQVMEKARKLERDSFIAMMRRKRRLQTGSDLV